jgi:hypothetical protein
LSDCIKKFTFRAGGMAQAVERLPSKCKALSSNPSTAKKKSLSLNAGRREGEKNEKM